MARNRRKELPPPTRGIVSSLSHDGRGIISIDGKTTFVRGALPQETVEFKYTNTHSQYDEGNVLNVLTSSPMRQTPQCNHADLCGGCSLQHLKPEQQITHKQQTLQELLEHHAQQPTHWHHSLLGPTQGYRRKARLSVKFVPKKNSVLIGFREHRSHLITDITKCTVLNPNIGNRISLLRNFIMTLEAKASIPQLEIAVADNTTAILMRHLLPLSKHDQQACINFSNTHNFCFFLQPKGIKSIHPLQPEKDSSLFYALPNYQLNLYFEPYQFLQINATINKTLIDTAISWLNLTPNDTVLDLFCGIGNFSLPIATKAGYVVGVEGENNAILQAQKNATINNIDNCEFHCSDLQKCCKSEPWYHKTYHKLLIDPPRSGAKDIIPLLKNCQPEKIIYISCSPASFARDAGLIIKQGYELTQTALADMFPHTQHAESIALFDRIKN